MGQKLYVNSWIELCIEYDCVIRSNFYILSFVLETVGNDDLVTVKITVIIAITMVQLLILLLLLLITPTNWSFISMTLTMMHMIIGTMKIIIMLKNNTTRIVIQSKIINMISYHHRSVNYHKINTCYDYGNNIRDKKKGKHIINHKVNSFICTMILYNKD